MRKYISLPFFSLAFGITYTLAVVFNWPLFRYYPLVKRFSFTDLADRTLGPAMAWYGWQMTAAVVALAAAVIVPKRWAERLWPGLYWLIPIAVIFGGFYREQDWFLK